MSKLRKKINNAIGKMLSAFPSGTTQASTNARGAGEYSNEIMSSLCRKAAAEGIVLLKNENNVLPLVQNEKLAVFSRVQFDLFFTGYGSGGDVNPPYKVNLVEGLKNTEAVLNQEVLDFYKDYCKNHPAGYGFWGNWPTNIDEVKLKEDFVEKASKESETAIYIIGRSSGEDMENSLEKGSWFLTDEETHNLKLITKHFSKVAVLLNCANIIDCSEIMAFGDKISAVAYIWQGGMESGNAVADVLFNKVPVSGRLADTVAKNYESYPSAGSFGKLKYNNYTEDVFVGYRYFESFAKDKVVFPFGYGLDYTKFEISDEKFEYNNGEISLSCLVKNVGNTHGKYTLQVYFSAPQGRLGKPSRELIRFKKTALLVAGESEEVSFVINESELSSYDDEKKFSFILEKGEYRIFMGGNVRDAKQVGSFQKEEDIITEKCSQCAAPDTEFLRFKAIKEGKFSLEKSPVRKASLKEKILKNLPTTTFAKTDKNYTLEQVKKGEISLDEFVSAFTLDELEAISRGDYTMNSPLGTAGNAGVYGGVLESLRNKGIAPLTFTDGPSGIRLNATASLVPIGTALACTFNTELVENLNALVGEEMKKLGSDIIASPGMNIHRNPLCGRNFEYFSEDPYLTGKMASAVVKGVQSQGVSACLKHYACNNQEKNRIFNDSRLSERALREIYLRGFEICVKEAKPFNIMTSYNKINGVWGHYHYELVTDILRKEWGYEGCVITDWWMRSSKSPEFPKMRDQAYRVRAGVNVLMPGAKRVQKRKPDGTLLETLGEKEGITEAELRENAKRVVELVLRLK